MACYGTLFDEDSTCYDTMQCFYYSDVSHNHELRSMKNDSHCVDHVWTKVYILYQSIKERDLIKHANPSPYLPAVVGPPGAAGLLSATWTLSAVVFSKVGMFPSKPWALSSWTPSRIWFDCVYTPLALQHSTTSLSKSKKTNIQPANSKEREKGNIQEPA